MNVAFETVGVWEDLLAEVASLDLVDRVLVKLQALVGLAA